MGRLGLTSLSVLAGTTIVYGLLFIVFQSPYDHASFRDEERRHQQQVAFHDGQVPQGTAVKRTEIWRKMTLRDLKHALYEDSSLRKTLWEAEEVAAHFNSLPARNLDSKLA